MTTILKEFKSTLEKKPYQRNWFSEHVFLIGDIHNHCNISYGHGSLKKAIKFANEQLDFFSVTGHFAWPDMEENKKNLSIPIDVINYHKKGFIKLSNHWEKYIQILKENNNDNCIAFPSIEFHSFDFGDYTIVSKKLNFTFQPLKQKHDSRLESLLNGDFDKNNILIFPHHIGYKQGYRGINWNTYNSSHSPVVEVLSMHGSSESEDSQIKYLHTMGPLNGKNTFLWAFMHDYRFGIIANTDHHNASPGSYKNGRTGIWAQSKTRDNIFNALYKKYTAAISGDPIEAMMFVNNYCIGEEIQDVLGNRQVDGYVVACDSLDKVELLQSGNIIETFKANTDSTPPSDIGRISFTFGWGEKDVKCDWNVNIQILNGTIQKVNTRFKGQDIVDPLDKSEDVNFIIPSLKQLNNKEVELSFSTTGNPTATTSSVQGISAEYQTNDNSKVILNISAIIDGEKINREYKYLVKDLKYNHTEYINGFVSPAIEISRFKNKNEYCLEFHKQIIGEKNDWYYMRVFQKNGDILYLTPIWEK